MVIRDNASLNVRSTIDFSIFLLTCSVFLNECEQMSGGGGAPVAGATGWGVPFVLPRKTVNNTSF